MGAKTYEDPTKHQALSKALSNPLNFLPVNIKIN